MINTQALALKLLLSCEDKDQALDSYEAISPEFFTGMYSKVYSAVTKFYREQGEMPTLSTLATKFSRNSQVQTAVNALEQVDTLGVDLDLATEALRDEYAQQEVLKLLQKNLLSNISMMSSTEIIDTVASIPLTVESSLQARGSILDQSMISVFQKAEELNNNFMNTGISNRWDNEFRGIARQEVILLGGRRGGGKSLVCSNLVAAAWKTGKIAPYYTIEMTGRETFLRIISIIAEVDALEVKNGTIKGEELLKLARARAKMFKGGEETYERYIEGKNVDDLVFEDFHDLDATLRKNHEVGHPLIIIDDSELRLATIDLSLSKFRAKYGDLLTVAVVDYLNEVKLDGKTDPYDWVYQKEVATGFKNLARKHDCAIVSPYQVADNGEARFSKSILDPVDMAFILSGCKRTNTITFASTKLRSLPDSVFRVPVDWRTLKVSPEDIPLTADEEEDARDYSPPEKVKKPKKPKKVDVEEENHPNPSREDIGANNFEL